MGTSQPVWEPDERLKKNSYMSRFKSLVSDFAGHDFRDYWDLYRWSISEVGAFWAQVADFTKIIWAKEAPVPYVPAKGGGILGARWFPGATLNFAENLIGGMTAATRITAIAEGREDRVLGSRQVVAEVAACAAYLKAMGVGPGDRVAAVLPNSHVPLIAMLATTSLGAVWSSCSPDFGQQGILDRFGQITPKVLFASASYTYGG